MAVGKFYKDKKEHLKHFDEEDTLNAFKVMGNVYRMNILKLLSEHPNLTLDQINQHVGGELKNIAAHTQKIYKAHLISKKYHGKHVQHELTPYGFIALRAYKLFQKNPY